MEGCPLAKNKYEGTCATCAQVNDCVFLDLAKVMEEVKTRLRNIERSLKNLESDKSK